jgi:hypothetical protein
VSRKGWGATDRAATALLASRTRPPRDLPLSSLCRATDLRSASFRQWAETVRPAWDGENSGRQPPMHRKLWEWLFIIEALDRGGHLQPGRRGLGFGVGGEPLTAYFASRGCEIVATDLSPEDASAQGWANQYAGSLRELNRLELCPAADFAARVQFQVVDMTRVPSRLRGFDFTWSSCAFEHLGTLQAGMDFVIAQMACLRPGGLAVHTTEFNLSSNDHTVEKGGTVLYRRRDIEALVGALRAQGHRVSCDFGEGEDSEDLHVDQEPYTDVHLRLRLAGQVVTSLSLVITAGDPLGRALGRVAAFVRRRREQASLR